MSFSDFLYLNLDDAKVFVKYNKISIGVGKIENEFGFQNFVNDYISLAKKNKQWGGGPLNKEWANKYYKFFGLKEPYIDWKPTIDIELTFYDRTKLSIGFSIITKFCCNISDHDYSLSTQNFWTSNLFLARLCNGRFGKDKFEFSYEEYYDILHRIIPNYTFNWEIDPTYN